MATSFRAIPECSAGILVDEEPCRIVFPERTIEAHSRVAFRIDEFPSAEVEITNCDLDVSQRAIVSIEFIESRLVLTGVSIDRNPRVCRIGGYSHEYRVRHTEPVQVSNRRPVASATAFIYNMGLFSFRGLPSRGLDPLQLDIDGCVFEIGPIPSEYHDLIPRITTPWHVPTNFLRITSSSAGGLQPQEFEAALFRLRQFLSFVWGRYVGIALSRGYDRSGEIAFAHWGTMVFDPRVPAAQQNHWFSPSHAEVMQDIFPGYWRLTTDRDCQDVVEWAIYWWLSANHSGQRSETSILASQAALEGLAFKILTPSYGSDRSFKTLKAAQKIRGLLKEINLTFHVPPELTELLSFATPKGFDGPEAFVQVRNALVHPSKQGKDQLAFQASQLGMWYLELTLLFLFSFNGQYLNRTVFGKPFWLRERVPWAPEVIVGDNLCLK